MAKIAKLPLNFITDLSEKYKTSENELARQLLTNGLLGEVWILKGRSVLMMFDKLDNLKYKFGNRHFWAEGYYVSTVGLNEATIKKYIQEQEKHDIALDKLSVKEYEDPFRDKGK